MKRVIVIALICAAFFLALHRPASAMVEFCPADLSYERVTSGTQLVRRQAGSNETATYAPEFSTLYGFELSALGPRSVTQAELAFDTTGGWYTVDVPAVTLVTKERHYSNPLVSFVRRDYVSPVLYVRFPQAVTINHAWVYRAAVQNDAPFGWQTQGTVSCDPPPAPSPQQAKSAAREVSFYHLADADVDPLSAPPTPTSLVITAKASQALEQTNCSEPFRQATVKNQVTPQYPDIMTTGKAVTSVEVAINAGGSLADAWVWGPSGFKPFDDAGTRAASASSYIGARSYCRDVPGRYFFRVTFDPN